MTTLDLTGDFVNSNGSIKKHLYTSDNIHLSLEGYAVFAERLKPLVEKRLGGKGLGGDVIIPPKKASVPTPLPARLPGKDATSGMAPIGPSAPTEVMLESAAEDRSLVYLYAPYNDGKIDLRITGWPALNDENIWVMQGEGKAAAGSTDIALLGDIATQGWKEGWDGSPFDTACGRALGARRR